MVSLCYRALHNYISENNLEGLQGFLENRRVLVDDRDDVRFNEIKMSLILFFIHSYIYLEWSYCFTLCCYERKITILKRTYKSWIGRKY